MSSTKKSGKSKASKNEGKDITSFFGVKKSTSTNNSVPSSGTSTAKKSGASTASKVPCKLGSTTSTNGGSWQDLHSRNDASIKSSLNRLNDPTYQQINLRGKDGDGANFVQFNPDEFGADGASIATNNKKKGQGKKRKGNCETSKVAGDASLPKKSKDKKKANNNMMIVEEKKVYSNKPGQISKAVKRVTFYSNYNSSLYHEHMARYSYNNNLANLYRARSSTTRDENLADHHQSKSALALEYAMDVQVKYPLLMKECILRVSTVFDVDPIHLQKHTDGHTPPPKIVPTKSEE